MILVLGVNLLSKYIKYFSKDYVCFYDDFIKSYENIPFFKNWDKITKVIIGVNFDDNHGIVKEAKTRKIPFDTDVGLFLKNQVEGFKIGVIGLNAKGSTCYLLKYLLQPLVQLGGELRKSPLEFSLGTFYIIEISIKQFNLMSAQDFELFDVLILTSQLSSNLYFNLQEKLDSSKFIIDNIDFNENDIFPNSPIFLESRYKTAWIIIKKLFKYLNFNVEYAFKMLKFYSYVKFKREIINEMPLIVNDSNSTTLDALLSSVQHMRSDFVLICNDIEFDINSFYFFSNINILKKLFIFSNKNVKFFHFPSYSSNNFEQLVKEAFIFAKQNNYDLLFSPGDKSAPSFKDFNERGSCFNKIIQSII